MCKRKSTVRRTLTEEHLEQVRQTFVRSPRTLTVRGSRELSAGHFTEEAKTGTISTDTSENF